MTSRISLIDALRGLAAMVVVWHHVTTHFPIGRDPSSLGWWISERNVEAVLLFFVLSGFSIRLSVRSLDMRNRADVNEYLYRRFRRILPLYVLSLALAGVIGVTAAPADPSSLTITTLLGNLAFLQTPAAVRGVWFVPFAENGPLWSLSYEMFYYLSFPPIMMLRTPRTRLVVVGGLTLLGLAMTQVWPNPIASFTSAFLIWYLGVELADFYLSGQTSVPWWYLTLVGVGILVVLGVRSSASLRSLVVGLLFFHLGYALIAMQRRGWRIPSLLERAFVAPLVFVGGFSYGLYLLHFPILRASAEASQSVWAMLAGVLGAIAIAYVAETRSAMLKLPWLRRRYF